MTQTTVELIAIGVVCAMGAVCCHECEETNRTKVKYEQRVEELKHSCAPVTEAQVKTLAAERAMLLSERTKLLGEIKMCEHTLAGYEP